MKSAVKELGDSPAGMENSIASIQEAFEWFDRQSCSLQEAYRGLQRDLAESNRELQARNHELIDKYEELRQISSRLESVIESMTDGLLVVGMDGRIERCNSSARAMLRTVCRSIERASLAEVVALEDIPELLVSVLQGGAPVLNRSWNVIEPDGSGHVFLVSLAPVSAPDRSVFGALCNLRDVTEIRRLEKGLHSHERLAALGEMAASVAHEIRNPLGTIEGFARLLRRDLAGMPDHLRLAERIVEGAQNLNYVITNLLTYARPMRLQIADVPVVRVLDACRETLRDKASRAGVRLSVAHPPPDIRVRGDERQLVQALLNLGINAIEACEASQSVRIETVGGRSSVLLRVCDRGRGMDDNLLTKIFDPFFTCKEGGTGLGLSLTRKIIDAHGADISVSSTPGRGSVFTVEFPRTGGPE